MLSSSDEGLMYIIFDVVDGRKILKRSNVASVFHETEVRVDAIGFDDYTDVAASCIQRFKNFTDLTYKLSP